MKNFESFNVSLTAAVATERYLEAVSLCEVEDCRSSLEFGFFYGRGTVQKGVVE